MAGPAAQSWGEPAPGEMAQTFLFSQKFQPLKDPGGEGPFLGCLSRALFPAWHYRPALKKTSLVFNWIFWKGVDLSHPDVGRFCPPQPRFWEGKLSGWLDTCYIVSGGLELVAVLLSQLPKCWNYSYMLPPPV